MNKMDALQKWWADPEVVVVPARQTEQIIEWLGQQSPDTWHQVVMTWNYDYGDKVLSWILAQENCDRGTAARIFLVEGVGHWLWDAFGDKNNANDETHVCNIVLRNWSRYKSGELKHGYDIPDQMLELVQKKGGMGFLKNYPLQEIMGYEGSREAVSQYGSEDGKIVVALDFWMKAKGIELTEL